MVTKQSPDSSEKETPSPPAQPQLGAPEEDKPGFFGLLVKSVFEPGANAAVVMAMNVCFFLLILTLFALSFLTGWNMHVLLLLGVTTLLWGSMAWFVMELTRVQTRPDNMPPAVDLLDLDSVGGETTAVTSASTGASASASNAGTGAEIESRKER